MRAIGIDLGTTNSAAAIAGKEVKVLPNRDNQVLTPSVVSLVRKRNATQPEVVVGMQAVNNAARDPVNTISSIKRLMGAVYGEDRVAEVRNRVAYRMAEPPAATVEDQGVRVLLGDQALTPIEISAKILTQIRARCRAGWGTGHPRRDYGPAYFTEKQRTRQTARCTGRSYGPVDYR
jgi:molecular chaperone HscA